MELRSKTLWAHARQALTSCTNCRPEEILLYVSIWRHLKGNEDIEKNLNLGHRTAADLSCYWAAYYLCSLKQVIQLK